jgi:hypothetical protein
VAALFAESGILRRGHQAGSENITVPNPLIQDPGRIRDLSAAMAKGEITAEALVRRHLDRIAAVDGQTKFLLLCPTRHSLVYLAKPAV